MPAPTHPPARPPPQLAGPLNRRESRQSKKKVPGRARSAALRAPCIPSTHQCDMKTKPSTHLTPYATLTLSCCLLIHRARGRQLALPLPLPFRRQGRLASRLPALPLPKPDPRFLAATTFQDCTPLTISTSLNPRSSNLRKPRSFAAGSGSTQPSHLTPTSRHPSLPHTARIVAEKPRCHRSCLPGCPSPRQPHPRSTLRCPAAARAAMAHGGHPLVTPTA